MMESYDCLIRRIFYGKEKYLWLIEPLASLRLKVKKVADFGCGEGWETLLLMCILNAGEGVGIDRCDQDIRNAHNTLNLIQNMIWYFWGKIPNDAPAFFRKADVNTVVQFYTEDITKPTKLPSDYYDIAFCKSVLYHVFLEDKGNEGKTQSVVNELRRIVRPEGVVAMREPTLRTGECNFCIDFKPFFEKANLTPEHIKETVFEGGIDTEYLYVREI